MTWDAIRPRFHSRWPRVMLGSEASLGLPGRRLQSTSTPRAIRSSARPSRPPCTTHSPASDYGWVMASPILLCTDGSDEARRAVAAGLELLGRKHELVVVTVMEGPDEGALAGSGHAGPDMTLEEYDQQLGQATDAAKAIVAETQSEFDLGQSAVHVLQGDPGPAICRLATELGAQAIVVGSRGRGILKRALLGSVSDHIVRNAPCSVVLTRR